MRLDAEHTVVFHGIETPEFCAPVDHVEPSGRIIDMLAVNIERPFDMNMIEAMTPFGDFTEIISATTVDGVRRIVFEPELWQFPVNQLPLSQP